ncbi:MAG: lactonase family protein [Bryobacteraceae bacterium]
MRVPILLGLAAVAAGLIAPAGAQTDAIVYVGTYTQHSGKGIYAWKFQASPPRLTPLGVVADTSNPSFLIVHPNRRYLYAVNEDNLFQGRPSGAVSAYAIDPANGRLTLLNQMATHSPGPCHLALDKTAKWLFVANYAGGSVTEFPVEPDGSLGENSAFIQHRGKSVDHQRQAGPHAHEVVLSPDNRFLLVPDLGLDEVLTYRLDAVKGTLAPANPPFTKIAAGSGPRHLAFHPNGKLVYLANELAATVGVYAFDAERGHLDALLQTVSMLPNDYTGAKSAAEIVVSPDGKFLYASNRGHDSIAVFAIDAEKGTLTKIDYIATEGKTPRNFALDPTGDFLFAANQDSDNVVLFRRSVFAGKATASGLTVDVPNPVCVVFR